MSHLTRPRSTRLRQQLPVAAFLVAGLVAGVASLAGCSSDEPRASAETATPSRSAEASETTPATSELEGTWTTDLKRNAVKAYIREQGWSKTVEDILLGPEYAGPEQTEIRIDYVGNRFRMSQAATDEQWQSGTFRIEDGRIYLDDEGPVGEVIFRVNVNGDTAVFDEPAISPASFVWVPGVPGWAPAAVLWSSTTWERAS